MFNSRLGSGGAQALSRIITQSRQSARARAVVVQL
jgi:hypothetical protein